MLEMHRDSVSMEDVGNRFATIAAGKIGSLGIHVDEGYIEDFSKDGLTELANLHYLQASLIADMSRRSEYPRLTIQSKDPIRIGQDYDGRHINGVNLASFHEKRVVIGDTALNLDFDRIAGPNEMDLLFYATHDGSLHAIGHSTKLIPIRGRLMEPNHTELRNRVIMGATFNISSPKYSRLDLIPFVEHIYPELIVDVVDEKAVQTLATYLGRGPNFRAKA